MTKKEKARSTAATAKRAEAAAFGEAATSIDAKFITSASVRQVSDVLPTDAENAIDGQTLAAVLGFKTVRELSKQIERERRAGQPICASVSGEHRGYFLGDSNELWLYLRSLDRRLREVRRTRDACEDTLQRLVGQEVLEGWHG